MLNDIKFVIDYIDGAMLKDIQFVIYYVDGVRLKDIQSVIDYMLMDIQLVFYQVERYIVCFLLC